MQLKNLKKNRQSAILAVHNKTRESRVKNGQRNIGLVYYAMAHSIGRLLAMRPGKKSAHTRATTAVKDIHIWRHHWFWDIFGSRSRTSGPIWLVEEYDFYCWPTNLRTKFQPASPLRKLRVDAWESTLPLNLHREATLRRSLAPNNKPPTIKMQTRWYGSWGLPIAKNRISIGCF